MNSAIFHSVSRCVSPGQFAAEDPMSTTSYNPNEASVTPARLPRKENFTKAGTKAGDVLDSQALSRRSLRDGKNPCGHSEGSDDDLITAAQRGDQQPFVELCGGQSTITKK